MPEVSIVEQLKAIAKTGRVAARRVDLAAYSYDATADVPRQFPDAVVMPRTVEEVRDIVNLARERGIAIYPRGAGTNLSGGTIPLEGGIVMSFQLMNRILELDRENLTATVQPGVVIQELNNVIAPENLLYPPDPGTVATATFGGSVAENSGGLRGLKYGVTKHYVMGMQVVLANGDIVRFGGKTVKNVTAYDFCGLFTGSEGTLGIITEITVKLVPGPIFRTTMSAVCPTIQDAGNAVAAIIKAHVIPATLEILDRNTILAVEAYAHVGLPTDAEALLLIEVDGMNKAAVQHDADEVIKAILDNNGMPKLAQSDEQRDQLWNARRSALPALASLNNMVVLEDATVPRSRITEMLVACSDIALKYNLLMATFGHAGDGNLHPTILADKNDPDEMSRVHQAVEEIFDTALKLGGTLSGEHGIGIAKMRFLGKEIGETGLDLMRAIKNALDPTHMLNPGKLVPFKEA